MNHRKIIIEEPNIMKIKIKIIFAALLVFISYTSCYEGAARNNPNDPYNLEIAYPESGSYGANLLRKSYIEMDLSKSYSMSVEITGNYSVYIKIPESSSTFSWDYTLVNTDNTWQVSTEEEQIIFSAIGKGSYDCEINILSPESTGSATIEIYENNLITPTRLKILSW